MNDGHFSIFEEWMIDSIFFWINDRFNVSI